MKRTARILLCVMLAACLCSAAIAESAPGFFDGLWQTIGEFAEETGKSASEWAEGAANDVGSWLESAGNDVSDWAESAGKDLNAWAENAGRDVSAWAGNAGKDLSDWAENAGKDVSDWAENAGKDVSTWAENAGRDVSGFFTGASPDEQADAAVQGESGPRRKVIIDTDTGADDASALILAARSEGIDILGVTVLAGNVDLEQGAKNALMALELAGCDAPVYKGSAENYSGIAVDTTSVLGKDGMGDADLVHPAGSAEEQDAIDFILDTVNRYPGEVEIVAIGPATNIAKAIERDPEAMKLVKRIWSMGTAGLGEGNATPVAEFNVFANPEAYSVMLDSGIDIVVVGLDMCGGDALWTGAQLDQLTRTNAVGSFVSASFAKFMEFSAANGTPGVLMNSDALAMMCAVDPGFVTDAIRCHASCVTGAGETRGQVLFYRQGYAYDVPTDGLDYNVTLVRGVRSGDFFDAYLAAIRDM